MDCIPHCLRHANIHVVVVRVVGGILLPQHRMLSSRACLYTDVISAHKCILISLSRCQVRRRARVHVLAQPDWLKAVERSCSDVVYIVELLRICRRQH